MTPQLRDDLILVCEKLLGWTVDKEGQWTIHDRANNLAWNNGPVLDANLAHEVKQAILNNTLLNGKFATAYIHEAKCDRQNPGWVVLEETPELIITAAANALRSLESVK